MYYSDSLGITYAYPKPIKNYYEFKVCPDSFFYTRNESDAAILREHLTTLEAKHGVF